MHSHTHTVTSVRMVGFLVHPSIHTKTYIQAKINISTWYKIIMRPNEGIAATNSVGRVPYAPSNLYPKNA